MDEQHQCFILRNEWFIREIAWTLRRGDVHQQVAKAIKKGLIPHPKTVSCTDCGKPAFCYDHRDYTKPLDVSAVCKSCDIRRWPGFPYYGRDTPEYAELFQRATIFFLKKEERSKQREKHKKRMIRKARKANKLAEKTAQAE
jgi:hypothetical protein